MIINEHGDVYEHGGTKYTIGGSIIGTNASEYEGLYGTIIEIRDGDDKETENETPDLYCRFALPILPCEKKTLEERFSKLYGEPKTTEDIALDMVIMAPKMLRPLGNLHESFTSIPIYLVTEEWSVSGEDGYSCEAFADYDDAKRTLNRKLFTEKKEEGLIFDWSNHKRFIEDSGDAYYEGYLDGDYVENHYAIYIHK